MTTENIEYTVIANHGEASPCEPIEKLPLCNYREVTARPFVFYCRHSAIRSPENLVVGSMCAICSVRETLCAHPRALPGEADPKSAPPWYRKLWNLTTSVASFVADGMKTVTKEQYDERLAICALCPERNANSCTRCGCNLTLKAQGRAFECPLNKWPKIPRDTVV